MLSVLTAKSFGFGPYVSMTKGSAVIKYLVVIGVVAVVLLAAVSGPYERFEAWYGRQEGWQIAGGVDLMVVLALSAFAAFSYRRWGEGRHGSAGRIRSAGQRDQQRNLCEEVLALQSRLGQGLVIIDDDRIQYANEAFCEISGYSLKELKTLPGFRELATEGESASTSGDRRERGGDGVETHSAILRRKDGQRVEVEVVSKALEGAGSSKSVAIVRGTTGQNRAEEARDGLASLIESAGDAITSSTLEGVLTGWNSGAERLYGYSADEAIGKTVWDVMDPLGGPGVVARNIDEVKRGRVVGPFDAVHHARDGRPLNVSVVLSPIKDRSGGITGVCAVNRSVACRGEEAEARLRESEERFRTAFEDAPVGVALISLDGRYLRVNRALHEMLGYSEEELLSKRAQEITHPEDREISAERERQLLESGDGSYVLEKRYICADGHVVWHLSSVSLIRDSRGDPSHLVCLYQDITGRKRAEQALRESEARFRAIFEQAASGIAIATPDRRLLETNTAYQEMLGYGAQELFGKEISEVTHPEDLPEDTKLNRELLSGNLDRYEKEKRYIRKDGELIRAKLIVSVVRDAAGEPQFLIGMAEDITRRKQAEEALREANRRLQELAILKADFTAMVAHELYSPLAVIRGYVDMLAAGELDPDDEARILGNIQGEADKLNALFSDMQEAATVERGDFAVHARRIPVRSLLTKAAAFAETLPGDHPVVVEAGADEWVWADPERIGQVLGNLLSNAAKYSPPGAPIKLRTALGNDRVRIEVSDRGYGIHPDDVVRVFEKFGRGRDQAGRKVAGVGLGLYLSRRIVRAHGSELELDSTPGAGSVFAFELDVAR